MIRTGRCLPWASTALWAIRGGRTWSVVRFVSAVVATAVVVAVGGAPSVSARPSPHVTRLTQSLTALGIDLESVSCPSPADCVAVGSHGAPGIERPVEVTETNGVWGRVTIVPGFSDAALSSVSCTTSMTCTAVGTQDVGSTPYLYNPIQYREVAGSWQRAASAGIDGAVTGVSCVRSTCTAVGYEFGGSYAFPGVVASETNGVWSATHVIGPGGFVGVSCPSSGDCTAIAQTVFGGALTAAETGGSFASQVPISQNENVDYYVGGISCPSVGDCTLVGGDNANHLIVQTETGGVWGAVTDFAPPEDVGSLTSVSCASPSDCVAVGYTFNASHGVADDEMISLAETNGVWSTPTPIASNVSDQSQPSVSCATATKCTAVGFDGDGHALYPQERDGVWTEVPGAPTVGRVSSASGQVTVSWLPPRSDGGSAVTQYDATATDGSATSSCTTVWRTRCTISGLTSGQPYVVTVVARNPDGVSATSRSVTVTPR